MVLFRVKKRVDVGVVVVVLPMAVIACAVGGGCVMVLAFNHSATWPRGSLMYEFYLAI